MDSYEVDINVILVQFTIENSIHFLVYKNS